MDKNRHMERYEHDKTRNFLSDLFEKKVFVSHSETKRNKKKEKGLNVNRENAVVNIDDQRHNKGDNFYIEKSKKRELTHNLKETRPVKKATAKREKALEIPCSTLSNEKNKLHVKVHVNRERLLHEEDKRIFDKGKPHTHNRTKHSDSLDCRTTNSSNVPRLSSCTNRYFCIKYEKDDEAEYNTRKSFHMMQSGINIMENGIFYRGNTYPSRHLERDISPSETSRVSSSVHVIESMPSDNDPHYGSKYHNNLSFKEHLDNTKTNEHSFGNSSNDTMQDQKNENKKTMKSKIKMKAPGNKEKKNDKNVMTTNVFYLNYRNYKKRKHSKKRNLESKHENQLGHTRKFQQEKLERNRCFFDEEDDAILVLQLVQREIKKQYERAEINNGLSVKRDNQEQNLKISKVKESRLLSRILSTTNIQNGTRRGKDTVFELNANHENQENNEIHIHRNETDLEKHVLASFVKDTDCNAVDDSDKENDEYDAKPPYLVDIKDIGVNVTPPHHAKRKRNFLRVPSKKDRKTLVKVGGGWNDIYHYFERHVPVKRFEYRRSPDVKKDSFLSVRSHYKCPSKTKKAHNGKKQGSK